MIINEVTYQLDPLTGLLITHGETDRKGCREMIPILDWQWFEKERDGFVELFGKACRQTGFFLLKNHGVPGDLQAAVFDMADRFFALPEEKKADVSISNNIYFRGWGKQGQESLDENGIQIDRKEIFSIGLDLPPNDARILAGKMFRSANQWPDIDGFRNTILEYYNAALALGINIHRAIALDLQLPENYFSEHFRDPLAVLRLLYYPKATGSVDEIGAGEHTDYGAITLLLTDGVPGLQVQPRNQDWIDVPYVDGAFVVNIGDCLMRWTNDIYLSTPHRVLSPERTRKSIAMFIDPNPDTIVEPIPGTGQPKYAPIRMGEYLMSRFNATYSS